MWVDEEVHVLHRTSYTIQAIRQPLTLTLTLTLVPPYWHAEGLQTIASAPSISLPSIHDFQSTHWP